MVSPKRAIRVIRFDATPLSRPKADRIAEPRADAIVLAVALLPIALVRGP
jgi:hypothetical protein